ncbi:MAG: hypothetical protein JSV56_13200 [Methanomassiliicoccales archaeon]|nr:MAG: hypothetical protein JSV56_13200 [Methanomassiliicoccales archaeon]
MYIEANEDVIPFRVALLLKRYKFGSNIAARYLGKPRGLVQSWMQSGEAHALAERKFQLRSFERKLRKVREKVTRENIYYLLAMRLLDLDIPPEYVGRHLGIPLSTVRSWKEGVSPKGVKKLFIDRAILDREFSKLMKFMRDKNTRENLIYYLSLALSETGRQRMGRRRIGGKTISMILTKHFRFIRPIPKETITCWIDGRRTPKNAYKAFKDNDLIESEYRKIVDELTIEHMDYHIAKALYNCHNWSYSKIAKNLGLDKEKVRGWVKKDRGNPVAKCFVNESLVEDALKKYEDLNPDGEVEVEANEKAQETSEADDDDFYADLEDEILYHLAFFPSGVSSPLAIKSILIDNKDADIEDIEEVLNKSSRIVRRGSRWISTE